MVRKCVNLYYCFIISQGVPGEKGQKGDLGQPAIDVFQAVKVFSLLFWLKFWTRTYTYLLQLQNCIFTHRTQTDLMQRLTLLCSIAERIDTLIMI